MEAAPTPTLGGVEMLEQWLTKTFRVKVTDNRVFVGQFRCTDRESNIVLANTHEYRPPADSILQARTEQSDSTNLLVEFTNRFVGLVVIPGKHILKIELEEWAG